MTIGSVLSTLEPICKAISLLFPGVVEVVVHDLKTDRIAYLENSFSARKVGDSSLVETANYAAELRSDGTIGPYQKSNSDGSRLKSVSALVRDADGAPAALLCVNLKTDELESARQILNALASLENTSSTEMLKNDWRELANSIIAATLKDLKISANQVKRQDRLHIVRKLHEANVLVARGAGEYVADALGISRANFYGLLREAKENPKDHAK